MAEVFKKKCGTENTKLQEVKDGKFDDLIEKELIKKAQVDFDIGQTARRLLRRFPKIRKPSDAIHVATCALYSLDELHTFDNDDLLALDGVIPKKDGKYLRIVSPPYPPPDDAPPLLLEHMRDVEDE